MKYLEEELIKRNEFLSDIDGKSLDQQQRRAVIINEDHNLVLAGAGSGKTLTIAGKIKYLTEIKKVNPEDILVLSFTKKTVDEMIDRVCIRMGLNVDVKTFHSLGMSIIGKGTQLMPEVDDGANSRIIDKFLEQKLVQNQTLLKKLVEFFGLYFMKTKEVTQFNDFGEYVEENKGVSLETLKSKINELKINKETFSGEKVKSVEELVIANYLFLNGIKYEYESDYKYNTATQTKRQYKPDFYLVDYDVYIEHFGITEDNQVPWLSKIKGKEYLDGIAWKREVHQNNDTKLLETYSYQYSKGTLFMELERNLKSLGVEFNPIDFSMVAKNLITPKNKMFSEFAKLIKTFINLFKSNGYGVSKISEFIVSTPT